MSTQTIMSPEEIKQWARDMHTLNAVSVDTECTGGAFQDEVFEIAVVRVCDGAVLFDQLFKPHRPISWHASKVNGFRTKDLKTFPRWVDYWDSLREILADVPLIAFNSPFDKRLIQQTCSRYELECPELNWFCAMKIYSQFVGRKNGLSLAVVCEELGITGGNHRAKEDAIAAAGIVQKLAQG